MKKLYGWVGKILRVDLTAEKITEVPTSKYVPKFIGGRGVAAKIYWDEVSPECKAFDPENKLIFMTGPVGGTLTPTSGRVTLVGKSPVTFPVESYFKSAAGGHWGPELKFAGYDGLIIEGKASKPVYLWINDGKTEIRDARPLWGLNTYSTQDEIWRRHGKQTKSMVIGPAGENMARVAVILTADGSAFGFGGFGGVMGSKNLKAIAVKGTGGIPVARPKDLMDISYKFQRLMTRKQTEKARPNPIRGGEALLSKEYVPGITGIKDTGLYQEVKKGTMKLGFQGCFACPVCCGLATKVLDGSAPAGGAYRCVDIMAMSHITDSENRALSKEAYIADKLFDLLGVSTYQLFNWGLIHKPWFVRLVSEGILTEENTGIPVNNMKSLDFAFSVLEKVAYREGIGDQMAEGPQRYLHFLENELKKQGKTSQAGKVKEIAEVDCGLTSKFKGSYARNGFSVDDTGWTPYRAMVRVLGETNNAFLEAAKNYTWLPYSYEIDGKGVSPETYKKVNKMLFGSDRAYDPNTWEGKPQKVIGYQRYARILDSLTWCEWAATAYSRYTPDQVGDWDLSPFYTKVTGLPSSYQDLFIKAADRIIDLERAIQVREGRTKEDEWFVDRVFEVKENKGWLTKTAFRKAMDDYYKARGWDPKTGIPKRSTLVKLDLKDVADQLASKYTVTLAS